MAEYILMHGIRIAKDFTPETFGRLTSIGPAFMVGRRSYQVYECNCGATVVARTGHVKCGGTTSCGCYQSEKVTKHGLRGHNLYKTWAAMIQRCCNPAFHNYSLYGGRGITVCDRWRESFANFLADMGERPEGCSIDRIDNSRGYEPGNCRWATKEQQDNNKRNNRLLTCNGRTMTIAQWERELGFPKDAIRDRLRLGWSVEAALTTPLRKKQKGKINATSY